MNTAVSKLKHGYLTEKRPSVIVKSDLQFQNFILYFAENTRFFLLEHRL